MCKTYKDKTRVLYVILLTMYKKVRMIFGRFYGIKFPEKMYNEKKAERLCRFVINKYEKNRKKEENAMRKMLFFYGEK